MSHLVIEISRHGMWETLEERATDEAIDQIKLRLREMALPHPLRAQRHRDRKTVAAAIKLSRRERIVGCPLVQMRY